MSQIAATPLVRSEARRLNIDLKTVKGTGVGGRITVADVYAAAPPPKATPAAAPPATQAGRGGGRVLTGSAVSTSEAIHEAGRLNVALSTVRGTGPRGEVTADDVRNAAGVPHPQAATYATGLPAFTASGMDPKKLLAVPQPARAAVAAAPTLEAASALAAKYAGMSDAAAREALAADPTVPFNLGGGLIAWPTDD